jgi:3-oxoacyl-[acyl-carrier-protein] synthase-1
MTARRPLGLAAMGLVTPLGSGPDEVARALFQGTNRGLVPRDDLLPGRTVRVGEVALDLPALPPAAEAYDCRNNRLMLAAIAQIRPRIDEAIDRFGRSRIGVVLGTSTSGVDEHQKARARLMRTGEWPTGAHYLQWEIGSLSDSIALVLGVAGPAYTIATACSASAKVFASGRRLIEAGICDAVVVGGADTLAGMTVAGFSSLEAISRGSCNPFSRNRDGINIGEGAAAFLMMRDEAAVNLLGSGECSDAYHISAPEPDGKGALQAMRLALDDGGLHPDEVTYINLHGTGTPLNDSMEAKAVAALFGTATPCSSTKAMVGHALGAAGACEAAFLWLTLHPAFNPDHRLPPHLWDGVADPGMPAIRLVNQGMQYVTRGGRVAMLSNSFAFGGNNVALAFGGEAQS